MANPPAWLEIRQVHPGYPGISGTCSRESAKQFSWLRTSKRTRMVTTIGRREKPP